MARNTSGKVIWTLDWNRYDHDKFRHWTDWQTAKIKDNVKERIIGNWSPKWSHTRKLIRYSLSDILDKDEVSIEAFFKPLIEKNYLDKLRRTRRLWKFIDNERKWMREGYSPFANSSQRVWEEKSDKKQQLHHTRFVRDGHNVHDLDKLIIASPRYHQEGILLPRIHYGEFHGAKIESKMKKKSELYRSQIQRTLDFFRWK